MKDLDKLYDLQKEVQDDPLGFVQKLQTSPQSLNVPVRPKIPEVPSIDWSKYSYTPTDVGTSSATFHGTRGKRVIVPEVLMQKKPSKHAPEPNEEVTLIRGRVKSNQKSETFNQLWTSEEQRKLEELLVEFPPERVESRRYRKIVDKLGTKTLQQVASRIQKYFIRLTQCGLPVPGRVPNMEAHRKKRKHKHHMKNKPAMPSTFLQAYVPPVYMPEDELEGVSSVHGSIDSESEDSDSDLDIPEELKDTEEYKELLSLKNLRQIKLNSVTVEHFGFKCDGCGKEPISGIRYHCMECPQDNSVDFCSICNGPSHKMSVIEVPINEEQEVVQTAPVAAAVSITNDKDYLPSKFNIPGHYNYLDPNYLPNSAS